MTAHQYKDIWYDSADLRLKLYARDYGGASNGQGTPVICMHGLTRNSADFESIATHLSERYRVISVDQRGRGKSHWDPEPAYYNPAVYVQDMFKLMGDLGITRAVLIGTSMGGIMAMIMGSMAPQAVIGMVINDVGPVIDLAGLERIKSYVGKSPPITSWLDAAARARETNGVAFPDYTDHDWLAFARRTYHVGPDDVPVSSYDPAISGAFDPDKPATVQPTLAPPDMWGLWDTLKPIPVLAIRGGLSDLLSAETLTEMGARHPDTRLVTVPNRGHAPMLDEPIAVAAIDDFIQALEARAMCT